MHQFHLILAYFGPETVMPVTSILATVAAVVLMFGKSLFRLVAYWVRRASFRGRHGQAPTGPHFGLGSAADATRVKPKPRVVHVK